MNCASNIITANFSGGKTHATTARVYQWSRGIELCITGADNLPQTFKAHFSVQKRGGVATTIVGIDERVDVPNVLFTIGKDIHVWLGASETEDDAEILYTVDIPVAPAPMPEYYDAEDTGVFDAVVEQVADYAATATAAANSAGASATAAAGSASAAAASASSAAGSAGAAEQARADAVTAKGQAETAAQTATEKAQQTAQNASQAALDAGRAESAAERAESAETGAGAAKTAAEAEAQSAAASAATANEKATLAGQSATAAAGSASAAAQSAASIEGDVQIAYQKASEAQTAAGQAVTAKEAAQTAQQGAETAATNAGQSASTATAKASEAATSASNAAQSKTDAEAAAARAEQAAATLTVDSALSDSSTNAVQNKVITAELTDVKTAIDSVTDTSPASSVFATKEAGTTTLPEGWGTTSGYFRGMGGTNPGSLAGTGSAVNNVYYYLATEDMDVYVVPDGNPSTISIGIFSGNPYGATYLVSPIYSNKNTEYPFPTEETPLHVEAGQYVSFSTYNWETVEQAGWTVYALGTGETTLKSTLPLTAEMESQVDAKINASVKEPLNTGYYHLLGEWARHAWDSSGTGTDSRNFRVRYTETLNFDTDCYLLAAPGFYICGYASTDDFSTATFLDVSTVRKLTAGVSYRIYMRRITEDGTEVADISTFANALTVSTALAPIELYAPTFADVSMFERVGVCGDSYAAGGGIISGIRSLTWGKNLERQAGITVDIYAKSGQNVVQWVQDAANGLPALLAGAECGLYWLQHGINGTSTAEALGTAADMSASPRPATFYGQYTEAVEQIKATFPNARIILATIVGSSFALYQTKYANVNAAIRAIAEYCQVMLVDVADDDFYRSPYYSVWSRSNHPTAMQCGGIAMANRRLISKCIRENGDYFVNYGVRS